MKKAILSLLAAVLLLPALAFAEGVFAFEEASYALIPKKSLVLEPVAQGIDEKLSYPSPKGIFSATKKIREDIYT